MPCVLLVLLVLQVVKKKFYLAAAQDYKEQRTLFNMRKRRAVDIIEEIKTAATEQHLAEDAADGDIDSLAFTEEVASEPDYDAAASRAQDAADTISAMGSEGALTRQVSQTLDLD
jgi:hypothetical protein